MRLSSGSLMVATCLTFGGAGSLAASPTNPTALEDAAAANSATQEAVYTYRRTKQLRAVLPSQSLWDAELAKRFLQDTRLLR